MFRPPKLNILAETLYPIRWKTKSCPENSQTPYYKILAETLYPVLKIYRPPKLKILAETLYLI